MAEPVRALALTSTGLDSMLAARVMQNQGIDVEGVCFVFRFDPLAETHQRGEIESLYKPLGIPVSVVDVTDEYIPMWKNPAHGYGSGVNPCIDCHLFMIRKAAEMMKKRDARFLITGEVVGQRPMSQNKPTLFHMDKVSGLKGLILRPLSAKCMPVTIPEEKGWVDREKLYGFNGRTRTPQMELAQELGITRYNDPAGGCILTEPNYSRRVKAYRDRRGADAITEQILHLCRYGRHLWPKDDMLVVVGRSEADNDAIEKYAQGWHFFEATEITGPLVAVQGIRSHEDILLAARITARYCGRKAGNEVRIGYGTPQMNHEVTVQPLKSEEVNLWIV